ncbi:unnamed protein product [Danaus chrysippus]|uniref:(African queen) hypothetical protein n=1 Tax=Danaus chrysippus TaxID=151541 RepID=A0A8J2VPP3_9NEOP|nr:unnamed protein product [Danaus chrysippus]
MKTKEKPKLKKKGKETKEFKIKSKKQIRIETEDEDSEEEEAICLYCNDLYSKSSEGWCSCSICKKCSHLACAGIDSDDDECSNL